MPETMYDVVVVGAGVAGASTAWRLSQDKLRILWLEAADDVGDGASKANSGIACSGFDVPPETLEAELVVASSPRWEHLCATLDVPFRRIGELVLAFGADDEAALAELAADALRNGVSTEMLDADEVRLLVPSVSPDVTHALHAPLEGIVDPMRLVLGYAQAAVVAGVELMLKTPVTGFTRAVGGAITHVQTPRGRFATRAVVNAAGLGTAHVAALAGDDSLRVWPRRGQFLVLDREIGRTVPKILAPTPSPLTRGVLAVPTTNYSLLVGPTAEDMDIPGQDASSPEKATDADTLARVLTQARKLLPDLRPEHAIKSFSGLRPATDGGYRVAVSEHVPNLVLAAGIRSTGVSSSPAVGDRVHALLSDGVGIAAPGRGHRHSRPASRRIAELDSDAAVAQAQADPSYRTIVCACEHVTAAEIHQALTGPIPARTIDQIRKRTRATGGRCQGAFCSAGVGFMLSVERDLDPWAVPQTNEAGVWGVSEHSNESEGVK